MTDEVQTVKRQKRKSERIWRTSKLVVHRLIYKEYCIQLNVAITYAKTSFYHNAIIDCNGDQRKLFKLVNSLLGRSKQVVLPPHDDPASLSATFNHYFMTKIDAIRDEFPGLIARLPDYFCPPIDTILEPINVKFLEFCPVTAAEIKTILSLMNKTTCTLDPFPTSILVASDMWIDMIVYIVNLCITTGHFPYTLKSAVVKPLLKKPTLDPHILKNYRPVSNLPFLSKVIEKVIAKQLTAHMLKHDIFEEFQSAYKANHSTETTLLKVFNDIMLNLDSGSGTFFILLDLSAAFDTIDYDVLCDVLQCHLGICGTALDLLRSFLQGRSQSVIIDGIQSELKQLTCGVPQGSVLGPIEFCLYMLPLGTILKYHEVQYHIYADDTQIYMSFKLNDPQCAIDNINKCISDLRTWMITNRLKINDSKTEFLIIRSPFSKVASLQDFTISVGGSSICCSETARNLGVIFDSAMNLESHIAHVCKIAYMNLRNIRTIRNVLTDQSASQLIHALISSRIDYCNSILYGMSDSVISDLQHIQNTAARILAKCGNSFIRSKIILKKLHWLPIKQRIVYKILITTYKAYHSIATVYL